MRNETIVVGTDGTAPSGTAVEWAAREAARRGWILRITHAFEWQWRPDRPAGVDDTRQNADRITATAVAQARVIAPDLQIEAETVVGGVASRLLAVADSAELMVLGNRGRGGCACLMRGSVSQRVAAHAPCPVVIVHSAGEVTAGPVVVHVDDAPDIDLVLRTAFDEAATRGVALSVYRAPLCLTPPSTGDLPRAGVELRRASNEHEALDELVAPWRDKYPQMTVETFIIHDGIAAELVRVSHVARLVVVGSRGSGSIAAMPLGSTGIELLHHAHCPVLIARQSRHSRLRRPRAATRP